MKKLRIDVCNIDDFGTTTPGEIIQRPDPIAELYVKKGYGIILEDLEPDKRDEPDEVEVAEDDFSDIETPESKLPEIETADLPVGGLRSEDSPLKRGRPRKTK